jgi:hypothetical protein
MHLGRAGGRGWRADALPPANARRLGDGNTAFLIERALDEERSQQFRLAGRLPATDAMCQPEIALATSGSA